MASSSFLPLIAWLGLLPPVQVKGPPQEAGRRFQAILWRDHGVSPGKRLAQELARSGITGVSVDQDEDPGPIAALGLPFYLDHAAGKGILHLRREDWESRLEAYESSRSAQDLVRPYPLLSRDVRGLLAETVETRVRRAAPFSPLMISLDDEISTTRFQNPIDFCFHESSLAAFRVWLKARYGGLEQLNRVWGRSFSSMHDVVPATTDQVRQRELPGYGWPANLADWNDHRSFMDQVLVTTLSDLCRRARTLAPGVPVGFEGGQAPAAFGGFDYSLLLEHVDYIEVYDIGGARELVRSLKRPGTLHFETVFPSKDPLAAELPVAQLYDAFAHGLSGVIVWSDRHFFGEGGRLSAYGRMLAGELPRLTGRNARVLPVSPGRIAILESQASLRLHWMLDSGRDGKTWLRRFSSYERSHSTSQAARLSWIRLLQDLGYPFHFVSSEQLAQGGLGRRGGPRVLILPSALAMSRAEIRSVARFAEAGGLVLADESPARYDEFLRLRKAPALDGLFGLDRYGDRRHLREGKLLGDAPRLESGLGLVETGLRPDGTTVAERHERHYCEFERRPGGGRTVLLNLGVAEYAGARLVPNKVAMCRELRRRVLRILERAGVLPIVLASVPRYPTILERILLGQGKRKVLIVRANCLENVELFRELLKRGPQPLSLSLPVAARVRSFWTGKELGRGQSIKTKLDPLRGAFFILEAL